MMIEYKAAVMKNLAQYGNNQDEYINNVIASVFKISDTNGDGALDQQELYQALKLLGLA
jgi:hypothetical protein